MATHPNNQVSRIYLTEHVNRWVLQDLLKVDNVLVESRFDTKSLEYKVIYACMKGGKRICVMEFDEDIPVQDRITAMQTALRIENGNHTEGQKSSPAKTP